MTQDLTTGNVTKTILRFSLPLILGNIFQLIYSFTDSLIVGRILGVQELAGVGATGSLNFLILGFANGMATGFCILVARYFGAKDEMNMKRAIAEALLLSLAVSIILSVASLALLKNILRWIHTPEDVYHHAFSYISFILGGIVITVMYNLLSGILRSVGDSKTPLYFLIFASFLNIGLDLFFIAVLHFGVSGAAIATLISQVISVVLCYIYLRRKFPEILPRAEHFKPTKELTRELLTSGLSLAFQNSFIAVGSLMVQSAVNALGTIYVAANTAASKVLQIFMQPLGTLGTAMSTFSSQNLGAGKLSRVRKGLRATVTISTVWSTVAFLLSIPFGPNFVGILVKSGSENAAEVIKNGTLFFRWHLLFFLSLGPLFIYRNTLLGIGNKLTPTMSGVLEFVVKVSFALFVAPIFAYPGIVMTEPVAWFLCAVLLIVNFYRDPRVKALQGTEEKE